MPHLTDLASELRPREFHARMSRRGRSMSVLARRTRTLAARRLAVLLVAIGVPAMAAPEAFVTQDATQLSAPAAMPAHLALNSGETPSFVPAPELALADAPLGGGPALDPETPLPESVARSLASPQRIALAADAIARPLVAVGTSTDRYRAEQCLAMAAYYEAASEGDEGMRAVAQVVLNRVSHPAWPSTVCGVVFQGSERATGCQFSFTCDGSMQRKPSAAAWLRARRVADSALAGSVYAPVGLATHYHTLAIKPYWASSLDKIGDIGFHRFYRWKGANGTRAAFATLYRGAEPMAAPAPRAAAAAISAYAAPATVAYPVAPSFDAPAPAAPASVEASPAAAPVNALPASGSVRPEYAQSGTWLKRP